MFKVKIFKTNCICAYRIVEIGKFFFYIYFKIEKGLNFCFRSTSLLNESYRYGNKQYQTKYFIVNDAKSKTWKTKNDRRRNCLINTHKTRINTNNQSYFFIYFLRFKFVVFSKYKT